MGEVRVSAIVPTYRRPQELERCLQALRAQTTLVHQVIVVVRRDDLASASIAHGVGAEVVWTDRAGVVAAMAAGVAHASQPFVAFFDDDVQPRPDWVARAHHHLRDHSIIAVCGRDVIRGPGGRVIEESLCPTVGAIQRWRILGNHHLGFGPVRPIDVFKGAAVVIRRDLASLPIGLRGSGAEVDWELDVSLRASTAGRILYDPRLIVDHYPARRWDDDQRRVPSAVATANAAYNRQLITLCRLSPRVFAQHTLAALLIGDASQPGMIRAGLTWLRADPEVRARASPTLIGRLVAIAAFLRGRRLGVQAPRGLEEMSDHSGSGGTAAASVRRPSG